MKRAAGDTSSGSAATALRLGWGEGSSYTTTEKTRAGEIRTVYWFVVDVGHDADGVRKRAYGRSLTSFAEAYARASKNASKRSMRVEQPREAGRRSESSTGLPESSVSKSLLARMTTSEYFQHWQQVGSTVSEQAKKRHKVFFTTHVQSEIGSIGITDVTTADVEALLTTLSTKTREGSDERWLSVGAVRNIVAPLRSMFRYASEVDEIIPVSPFLTVPKPKPEPAKID